VETEHDEAKRSRMVEEWKTRVSPVDELKKNRQFFIEIILVRHIENFLNYLSSLLFEIFTQRPETLRSSDRVEVATVLRHESIESIVRELAERKVESLSYSSFGDLAQFFQDRFKLQVGSDSDIELLTEAIEVRNISVHNRCVINRRFVGRLALPETSIGSKRELFVGDLDKLVPLLAKMVKVLDKSVVHHLNLKGVLFSSKRES
jgi:hypothetical protein